MAIDFPSAPSVNDTFSANGVVYTWDGTKWTAVTPAGDKIVEGNTSAEVIDTGSDGRFVVTTEGVERLKIDSSGRLGLGTSSPSTRFHISESNAGGYASVLLLSNSANSAGDCTGIYGSAAPGTAFPYRAGITFWPGAAGALSFHTGNNATPGEGTRMYITSSGNVGVGTSSPQRPLHVNGTEGVARFTSTASGNNGFEVGIGTASQAFLWQSENAHIELATNNTERMRIDSSGRLLVGTSSSPSVGDGQYARIVVQGYTGGATAQGYVALARGEAASTITAGEEIGTIAFTDSSGYSFAYIGCSADATAGTNDYPGRLVFSTTADGASSPTERMRITSGGDVLISKDTTSFSADGLILADAGYIAATRTSATPLHVIRNGTDGDLVSFEAQNVQEGTISVSGTTVSYNGAHLSRWSQLASGAARTEILRGSVLSNLDEMCEWGEEDNEQLNRMKVSDVEGDKNVSGVFQAWDDDDDTYTNDFYCAMTGDFIIRIGAGVTVERGDLLMSAGDGTAKPQDDDIIRSKTIAKVTSTNVSCTYEDGSYCVPCVLMAC